MDIIKGLVKGRLSFLEKTKDSNVARLALTCSVFPDVGELDDLSVYAIQSSERLKAQIEACDNEIEELTAELQQLLRMEIQVGLLPDVDSVKKGRL